MTERQPGILHAAGGRLRLGWRLLAFMVLAVFVMSVGVAVLPIHRLSVATAMLAGGLLAGWALLAIDGRGPGALGFYLSASSVGETAKGLALGVAVGLVVVAVMALAGGLVWSGQPGTPGAWLVGAWGAFAFLAIPAAAEEAVLRGYLLQALAEALGPLWALGVTSVAFGLLHAANPGATPLSLANVAVAGAFLGVVYLKTASLWWATGAHLGWNWAHGYLVDVPVSGLELMDAPYYDGSARGVDWLSGGAFGPEGSVVATLVVLGATVVCWRTDRLKPGSAALAARPLAVAGET